MAAFSPATISVTAFVKIRRVARAQIAFHDGRFAVRPRDDEIARLDGFAVFFGRRNINQLDGLGDFDAVGNGNERAVREESLVERGKGVVRSPGVFAEMLFDKRSTVQQSGGKAFREWRRWESLDAGKLWLRKSRCENEAGPLRKHRRPRA